MDNKANPCGKHRIQLGLIRPADILIIAAAAAIAILAVIPAKGEEGSLFVEALGPASGGKRSRAAYPLNEDRTFTVMGREGEIVVQIKGGSVAVISAPCKNRICVSSPPLKMEGEWTACAPGGVMIRIESSGASGGERLDAIAY